MKATTSKKKIVFELNGNTYIMYAKKNITHPVDLIFDCSWEILEVFKVTTRGKRKYLKQIHFSDAEKKRILVDLQMQKP